jgi:hypothetical protein
MTAPAYLFVLVPAVSVAAIVVMLLGLSRALSRADWPTGERARTVRAAAMLLFGWFGLTALLAWAGAFEGAADRLPTIPFGILVPIAVGWLLIWGSPTMSRIVDAVPQQWLIGLHMFRALGATFLFLYAAGSMPGLFALPAGIGDLAVVGLAPFVAWAYVRNPGANAGRVAAWNVLGIADFVVAIATGFATGPSPLQLAAFDTPNTLITQLPLVLIPTFLVPLWTVLHIASLTKLRRARRRDVPGERAAVSA